MDGTHADMAEVALHKVSRVFARGVVAVDSVELSVERGELLVLLGPSGSGKSTLLRLIAGLDDVTSGEIVLGGQRVDGLRSWQRDVAMVLQQPVLYSHRTVRENLAFGLRLRSKRGWPWQWLRRSNLKGGSGESNEIDSQVVWAAQFMRIEHLLDRMPDELAGGEQQRVALGRALTRCPKLFLLDEPLTSLDAPLRNELRDQIKSLQKQRGTTMIYVTHDQAEAFALADRIAVMRQGRIEQIGSPEEIYDTPATQEVARLVGIPAGNFIEGDWERQAVNKVFRSSQRSDAVLLDLTNEVPRGWRVGPVVCAIRPGDVRIDSAGRLDAVVDRVSMMGDHQLVRLGLAKDWKAPGEKVPGEQTFLISKVSRPLVIAAGERVKFDLDMRACHWFDQTTGKRIDSLESAGFSKTAVRDSPV